MSLQYHHAERFVNRQDPWILKAQRDHLEHLTADFQAALNSLEASPELGLAALSQKVLHPFCHLCNGEQPLAQGAAAGAARLLLFTTKFPGQRRVTATAYRRARDCRDSRECVVQDCDVCVISADGACGNPTKLTIVWKPMTNGEWRLFVMDSTGTLKPEEMGLELSLKI